MRRHCFIFALAATLAGCGINPVTGQKELQLVSMEQEISIGTENYGPSRQMQGGDYVVDPSVQAYVRSVGARLARVSDRELPYEFSVVNDSVPNAWALPGGKIAVNRGLLVELGSEAELAAVLGHEITHAAARHGAKAMERGMVTQGALTALSLASDDSRYAGLIVGGAQLGAGLITMKYGRDAESEADAYGMRYMARAGYNPRAAVTLQETFVKLSQGEHSSWLDGLFASHPPSAERVAANRKTAAELGDSGEYGREQYLAAIKTLLDSRDAYAAFDQALQAFAADDQKSARALVQKAIHEEPREARFHALLGDVEAHARRNDKAQAAYDRAVHLNPGYFQGYLSRGLLRQRQNKLDLAKADLAKSIELLPTASAHNALGEIAARRGSTDEAMTQFRIASRSASDVGRAASLALARLELPRNPTAYLDTAVELDAHGLVILVVANRSAVPLRDVDVDVGLLDSGGALLDHHVLSLRQTLAPGTRAMLPTGLGPLRERAELQRVTVQLRAAQIAE